MSRSAPEPTRSASSRRRVHPRVAVTLLETIREQDLPSEVLEAENPTVTMPRRLGLSEVVEKQILRYRDAARRKQRLSDDELESLVRLAIRRPDAGDVFFLAGRALGGSGRGRIARLLPSAVGYALARRRVGRLLRRLFGRKLGGFASGPFALEGRALPFVQSDPGGDACALVTGLSQSVVEQYVGDGALVVHRACQARGGRVCRWTSVENADAKDDSEESGGSRRRNRPTPDDEPEGGSGR